MCDIVLRHCPAFRRVYLPYVTNQAYQEQTYQRLLCVPRSPWGARVGAWGPRGTHPPPPHLHGPVPAPLWEALYGQPNISPRREHPRSLRTSWDPPNACLCRQDNAKFPGILAKLEEGPVCQRLPLTSFLILPFQRIMRLKMLVEVSPADRAPGRRSPGTSM